MSVYVIDAPETSSSHLFTPTLSSAARPEPAVEPRVAVILDEAADDLAPGSEEDAEGADEVAEAAGLDAILPAEEIVLMPYEELALRVAALESAALAKLDALIDDLQSHLPRRGRHVADEVTFSIRSFLGGYGPRHLAESVAA